MMTVMFGVAVLTTVYLLYVLLNPEKF
ncbi:MULTISPECIES: potassium-transporting ATPase subunit F [Fictibacillus]|nr:potassium-transporting ATPase subunit F [Fictibacillus sp. 26RED30]